MNKLLTLGEERVRVTFNPSTDSAVDAIKQQSAAIINLANDIPEPIKKEDEGDRTYSYRLSEFRRLKALAMTSYEEGAMWAVKAITI
jgi:hypothetical protein